MGKGRNKRCGRNIGSHKSKTTKKLTKTRRRTRDLDQLFDDLHSSKRKEQLTEINPDLPGLGQHYCVSCGRYFIGEEVLKEHFKTKAHKQMLKKLKKEPYRGPEERIDKGKSVRVREKKPDLSIMTPVSREAAELVASLSINTKEEPMKIS
eukprot:TRINITY_DN1439_c0_g1_i1.p1 TRINITY_DN1439_c0_g1~~TRINITY_DN1439_c0_g1_i1.p1  ORF type:complete len:163 (+),score=2.51 TRINITY_DN1439_c0_g1_i1:39-491(+)